MHVLQVFFLQIRNLSFNIKYYCTRATFTELIRKVKVADSKISGYVWTGPKYTPFLQAIVVAGAP